MTHKPSSDVLLGELTSVLAEFAGLLCTPTVTTDDDGRVVLTVAVAPTDQETVGAAVETTELFQRLQHVVNVGTLRALARHYDIPPESLIDQLPPETV